MEVLYCDRCDRVDEYDELILENFEETEEEECWFIDCEFPDEVDEDNISFDVTEVVCPECVEDE